MVNYQTLAPAGASNASKRRQDCEPSNGRYIAGSLGSRPCRHSRAPVWEVPLPVQGRSEPVFPDRLGVVPQLRNHPVAGALNLDRARIASQAVPL